MPSSNHASPSGQLPFLLPAGGGGAVKAAKILEWVGQGGEADMQDPEAKAVLEMVDSKIRNAWVRLPPRL